MAAFVFLTPPHLQTIHKWFSSETIPRRRVFREYFLAGIFSGALLSNRAEAVIWAGNAVNRMKIATAFLAALLLVECRCPSAQSYGQSSRKKCHTNWPGLTGYFSE